MTESRNEQGKKHKPPPKKRPGDKPGYPPVTGNLMGKYPDYGEKKKKKPQK